MRSSPTEDRLSVIIVAYKSHDELRACIQSIPEVIAGASVTVEIVVVDNSQNIDGTKEVVESFGQRARYISPGINLGFGRANNLGYALTSGSYVLFLNPDTICNEDSLYLCVTSLTRDQTIGLISPKLVLMDGTLDLACRRSIPTLWDGFCRAAGLAKRFPQNPRFAGYNLTYLPEKGTYDVGAINGAFMMGRREVFETVGVFDEQFFMYGDDLDLCIRMAKAGYRIVYNGSVQITHVKGVSVAKDYDKMSTAIFDANLAVYLKHFNPRNSPWIKCKYTLAFWIWKKVALWRGRLRGRRVVRPL